MNTSKFILLEGLQHGNKFFTKNESDKPESEKVKLKDGTIAYKILGYAHSVEEAQYKLKFPGMEIIGYLIIANKDKNQVRNTPEYYSIDQNSGGYPCWTSFIGHAEIFADRKKAVSVLENDSCFNKNTKMADGRTFPPRMIHIAAGINYLNPKGTITLSVVPLIVGNPFISKEFTGEIVRPKEVE